MPKSLGAKALVYPTPVFVVGSYDAQGRPNAMTASWGGICCSRPPCVTISLRPATYSYGNIMHRRAYTINVPSESLVRAADYFGNVSGRHIDKFAETGLTPIRSELVDAPYIREFPFVLECRVIHIHKLGLHTQFIGEIIDIKVDPGLLNDRGELQVERLKPISYAPGGGGYFGLGRPFGKKAQSLE